MNCSRMKPETHWTNVGYSAAKLGWPIEKVLVHESRPIANQWIRNGYAKGQKDWNRLQCLSCDCLTLHRVTRQKTYCSACGREY